MSADHTRVPRSAEQHEAPTAPERPPASPTSPASPAPVVGLTVGRVDDPAERTADARADGALARLRRYEAQGRVSADVPPLVQRLRRAPTAGPGGPIGAAGGVLDPTTTARIDALRPSGSPLPAPVRRRMEDAFGSTLGHVRVHDGPESARLNADLSAQAFTSDNDIFFGASGFSPANPAGEHVLAHEIAHVLDGNDRAVGREPVRRLALPLLPTTSAPSTAQRAHIDAALVRADSIIEEMLASERHTPFIERTFGTAQLQKAVTNYGLMRGVLTKWRTVPDLVQVSGWATRFRRDAATSAIGPRTTLPTAVLDELVEDLAMTFVHESSHGISDQIIDHAYAGSGFRLTPGPERLVNAPHYDFAARMWMTGEIDRLDLTTVGNPNAGAAGKVTVSAPLQPQIGVQLQRAVSLITHVRVHAENLLQALAEQARTDETPARSLIGQAAGIPMPIHQQGNWFVGYPKLTQADIDAADQFAQRATVLHQAALAVTYTVDTSTLAAADSCTLAGNLMTVRIQQGTDLTSVPIQGSLDADPWVRRFVTAIHSAHGAAMPLGSLAVVDQQYHKVRGQSSHS
jgi:hypothetical protein